MSINLLETNEAMIWANEFLLIAEQNDWTLDDIDEGLMISWFANAFCAQEFKDKKRIEELEAERDRLRKAIKQYLDCQTTNQWTVHFRKALEEET